MTIKRGFALVMALAALPAIAAAATAQTPPVVGADRDPHGCIGSAGYTWSQVRHKCLRLFEDGIRLNPVRKGAAIISAFVLFASDDDTKVAELFLPGQHGSILLRAVPGNGAGLWRNRAYKLSQWKGMYMLDTVRGRALYQGSVAP